MKGVTEYRSAKSSTILQVHLVHALEKDLYTYRYIEPDYTANGNINHSKFIAAGLGISTSSNWNHIEKDELDKQLKLYNWKKIRGKRN